MVGDYLWDLETLTASEKRAELRSADGATVQQMRARHGAQRLRRYLSTAILRRHDPREGEKKKEVSKKRVLEKRSREEG